MDANGFEGPPSMVNDVRVAALWVQLGGPGRRASVTVDAGLFCALDGAELHEVRDAIQLSPGRSRLLRCARTAAGDHPATETPGTDETGPVVLRAAFGPALSQRSWACARNIPTFAVAWSRRERPRRSTC